MTGVAHAEAIGGLLEAGGFVRRPASWVATSGACFYKIPRRSDDCAADLADARAVADARSEFEQAALLAAHDAAVNRPCARERACLVYPLIEGDDLRDRLRRGSHDDDGRILLEEAVSLCGRLHRIEPEALERIPSHDYRIDPFAPAPEAVMRRLRQRATRLVVRGFEARNFRMDAERGRLVFFDPHELVRGMPEEDFTRFVLSLLMIGWGRGGRPSAWTAFDLDALRVAYERASGEALDPELERYAFDLNVRMRRTHARNAIAAMPRGPTRLAATAYAWFHFRQIDAWRRRHGL
ncbi:MAG: hypothetical protein ACK54X_13890 [Burkholderiales bacterium]|jgi:hypothetical protein